MLHSSVGSSRMAPLRNKKKWKNERKKKKNNQNDENHRSNLPASTLHSVCVNVIVIVNVIVFVFLIDRFL